MGLHKVHMSECTFPYLVLVVAQFISLFFSEKDTYILQVCTLICIFSVYYCMQATASIQILSLISGHLTFIQRRINVDAAS